MINNGINGFSKLVLFQYQITAIEKYSSITYTTEINDKCEHKYIYIYMKQIKLPT